MFFDAAGTLVRVRGGVGEQYAAVARRFGVEADPRALAREFPAAFRAAPPMAFPGASPAEVPGLERRVWQGLVRRVFEGAGMLATGGAGWFEDYFDAVYRHFEDASVWDVYPDVWPILGTLRARGHQIGVISNFDGRFLGIADGLGLARWFDSVTLSSRVGAVKPQREIFAHALAAHGVEPGEALHVGDSPAEDVEGALAAGLGAVLIDRDNRHAGLSSLPRVTSLDQILQLL